MNIWDIIILLGVAAIVGLAVRQIIKNRKSGSSCHSCGSCDKCRTQCANTSQHTQ